jgi:hypothetical protein
MFAVLRARSASNCRRISVALRRALPPHAQYGAERATVCGQSS